MRDLCYRWNKAWWPGASVGRPPVANSVRHRLKSAHFAQSLVLFEGMRAVLALCRLAIAEPAGLDDLLSPSRGSGRTDDVPIDWLLARLQARRIGPFDLPDIYRLFQTISQRAGFERAPDLYCIPSGSMNAFALGGLDGAAVVVTDGLLRNLTLAELAGILAHEIAHIRNSDSSTMALARRFTTATELVALLGLLQLVPASASRRAGSLELSLLLRIAPTVSKLLQLALSRSRELEADLDAAELAGDAFGLARAIEKLERHHAAMRPAAEAGAALFSPGILFRSHPETPTRMRWLFAAGLAAAAAGDG